VRRTRRGMLLTFDAKRRAKNKGIPFSLDWKNIQDRIENGYCELTGIPFNLDHPKSWDAPSIDQIIASNGYTPDNTRVVLYSVNVMIGTWGVEHFLMISDYLRLKRNTDIYLKYLTELFEE